MDEYWLCDSHAAYCFCYDGEWYHLKCENPTENQWRFQPVTMEKGLPNEMHVNYYNEVDLGAMLTAISWTLADLQSEIGKQRTVDATP